MKPLILRKDPIVRASVRANLNRFIDANAEYDLEVTIKRHIRQRTHKQSKALFGLAYPLLRDHTGYSLDDIHEWMCGAYFGWNDREVMGRNVSSPRRTTTTDEDGKSAVLNTVEFAAFFDFVQQKGAEAGVFIPDPDPFWRQHREEEA